MSQLADNVLFLKNKKVLNLYLKVTKTSYFSAIYLNRNYRVNELIKYKKARLLRKLLNLTDLNLDLEVNSHKEVYVVVMFNGCFVRHTDVKIVFLN